MAIFSRSSGQPEQHDERTVKEVSLLQKHNTRQEATPRSLNSPQTVPHEQTNQTTALQSERISKGPHPTGRVMVAGTEPPLNTEQGRSGHHKPQHQEPHEVTILRQRLQAVTDRYAMEKGSTERHIAQLEGRIKELTDKIGKLQADNDQLGEDIRSLQVSSFNRMDDARWLPPDRGKIEDGIDSIRSGIAEIAKSYATNTKIEMEQESEENQTRMRNDLQVFVHFGSEEPKVVQDLFQIPHAARLCLEALISNEIHRKILCDPFFFIDNGTKEACQEAPADQRHVDNDLHPPMLLSEVYRDSERYDKTKANIWRSDTLRLMNPLPLQGDCDAQARVNRTEDRIKGVCEDMAHSFASRICRLLLKPLETPIRDKLVNELVGLFIDAGHFFAALWTQRPAIECLFLPDLLEEPYSGASEKLKAHTLHRHDPYDHEFDGRMPKIVVHPAILAAGTHDGDHYHDQSQVWAKAVVWLDA